MNQRERQRTLIVLLIRPWAHFSGGLHMSESVTVNPTCIHVQTCMHAKSLRIYVTELWDLFQHFEW